ncbi:hypothetical protein H0H92_005914, partial [Tricholoma furcatifolium]
MSATEINDLMQIWGARHAADGPPFDSKQHLYDTIDSASFGDIPWQSFSVQYNGDSGDDLNDSAPWKRKEFVVHYRDARKVLHSQLQNPDFANEIDYGPIQVFDEAGKRRYCNFMSGNWANHQADIISEDPRTHGSAFCPVILGSDKTTVSVATGHTEYYPVYISNGMIHNNVRRAHRNGLSLLAFLAIPKMDAEHQDSDEFQRFWRSLFHGALAVILESLRAAMKDPEVVRFGDGHYRRVIYGIGPYMADYPEQVLLACIVQARFDNLDSAGGRRSHQHTLALFDVLGKASLWDDYGIISDIMPFTHGFPRADIHELISPDLHHQIIKGTFKDHLVMWINEYLELEHTKAEATRIIADIDQCIAAVPPFPGLRRFPEGRGFKQWTGDDSKALMKQLPDMFPLRSFNVSSILWSFAKAVKEPWRRSNRYEALGQMLTINQRLSKLAACRVSFRSRGMLRESIFGDDLQPEPPAGTMNGDDDDGGAVDGKDIWGEVVLSQKPNHFQIPQLHHLISRFLYQQENPDFDGILDDIPIVDCPTPTGKIR